jgi:poly(hydroxyalkanoate) depolymerase family esterase
MNPNMEEATRLTRAGRLAEAMVLLRGPTITVAPPNGAGPNLKGPETDTRIIDMVPPLAGQKGTWTAPSFDQQSGYTAPEPGRLSRGKGVRGLMEGLGKLHTSPDLSAFTARHRQPPFEVLPEGARFEERSFANQAGSRAYKLYVPSNYKGEPLPLVIMLHGCTQSPDDFAAGTRMNQIAEEVGFLVAYPGQPSSANPSKCWNWFSAGDQLRDQGEPSLIAGITRQIMRDFRIEHGKVFVAGLSAGGAAAAIMGSAYPDLYAAVGIHSGLACGAAQDMPSAFSAMKQGRAGLPSSSQPLRAIVFHGDRDTTVSPVNGDQVIAQSKGATELRTTVSRSQSSGGQSYSRSAHTDHSGRLMLEHWVLHGAGHAWSGGSAAGSYTDPKGPDASREMIRFFLERPTVGA